MLWIGSACGGVDKGASAGFTGANVLVLGGEVGGDVYGPQFFECLVVPEGQTLSVEQGSSQGCVDGDDDLFVDGAAGYQNELAVPAV